MREISASICVVLTMRVLGVLKWVYKALCAVEHPLGGAEVSATRLLLLFFSSLLIFFYPRRADCRLNMKSLT